MQQFSAFSLEKPSIPLGNIIRLLGCFLSNPTPSAQNIGPFWRSQHKMGECVSIILHKGSPTTGAGVVSIYHRNMNIPCPPGDDCLRILLLWCNLPRKAAAPAAAGKGCPFCHFHFYSGRRCCRSREISSSLKGRHSPGARVSSSRSAPMESRCRPVTVAPQQPNIRLIWW